MGAAAVLVLVMLSDRTMVSYLTLIVSYLFLLVLLRAVFEGPPSSLNPVVSCREQVQIENALEFDILVLTDSTDPITTKYIFSKQQPSNQHFVL